MLKKTKINLEQIKCLETLFLHEANFITCHFLGFAMPGLCLTPGIMSTPEHPWVRWKSAEPTHQSPGLRLLLGELRVLRACQCLLLQILYNQQEKKQFLEPLDRPEGVESWLTCGLNQMLFTVFLELVSWSALWEVQSCTHTLCTHG